MIRYILSKVSIFAVLSVMCVSALPVKTHAADFNLTASPLPINLTTKPGQTITTPLRVQNTGSETVRINVSLKKFGPTDTSGKPSIVDPESTDDFINWVSFSETSFTAEPNVWKTITMTITPPKDAAFGYYYAVIFSHEGGQKISTGKVSSSVKGAIASLVLLDVDAPGAKRTLSVTKFSTEKKLYQYLPAKFTVTIHNAGNVHAIPAGNIFIGRDKKGSMAALDLNSAHGNVLPKTDRQFEVQWNDGYPVYKVKKINGQAISDKDGKPVTVLDWNGGKLDPSKIRAGRYYAHLVMTYNDGTRDIPVEGDISFWVFPWGLILMLILGLAGLLLLSALFLVVLVLKIQKRPVRKTLAGWIAAGYRGLIRKLKRGKK